MDDYLVIGSGFGGSVFALRLAEKGYRTVDHRWSIPLSSTTPNSGHAARSGGLGLHAS